MTKAKQTHDNHIDFGSRKYVRGMWFFAENNPKNIDISDVKLPCDKPLGIRWNLI
ncbi:hypothetical protein MACH09_46530 [Vibrio sp. MACH09]|uniref:hypothetical protein n=1 Tax=Vibrio sp. MACH09 TaxID=3025122 RepID=UPI002791909D|nr:hypothetical protein MACH09_46530 [Vibrio sp. MACH09]